MAATQPVVTLSQRSEQYATLASGLDSEWLETNGLGGFASSTLFGCNTRRYHALLVADPHADTDAAPAGRRVLLNKFEETLICNGTEHELSTNIYLGATHPHGYRYLIDFTREPWPTFTFRAGNATLRKEIFMPHGQNSTVICYTLLQAAEPVQLTVKPLVSGREFHHLTRADSAIVPQLDSSDAQFCVRLYDEPSRLWVWYGEGQLRPMNESGWKPDLREEKAGRLWYGDGEGGQVDESNRKPDPRENKVGHSDESDGCWYYSFHYPREAERGLDAVEDLYCPGQIRWELQAGDRATIIAARKPVADTDIDKLAEAEAARREEIAQTAADDPIARHLFLAADQFIIKRRDGKSIIAGYPWFNDWGRDTTISLPGLTIATGRHGDCRDILRTWLRHLSDGLIPNCFSDDGDTAYNSADATLWLFAAARQYYAATGDLDFFAGDIYAALIDSLRRHVAGTGHDIAVDHFDALLVAGTANTQLTWMDAKVGDWAVTPRHGKPVEINALWYNALRTGQFFAEKFADTKAASEVAALARKVKKSFRSTFYSDALGYCYDVITPDGPDETLRPNQLIACALPYALLTTDQIESIVKITAARLLTDCGLRTLEPDHPAYRGRCEGDVRARDGAYHQGTVWPWLIGPYLRAYRAAYGNTAATRAYMRKNLQPLIDHLMQDGSIAEIFDGDAPQRRRGCIAQAWSVAQVIESWMAAQEH